MKSILLVMLLSAFSVTCFAQGVFSNQTNNILIKVVQAYPRQFKNIKGELISSGAGAAEFKSTVAVPGAVSTVIIQSSEEQKQIMSWQSVLYTGQDFKTAKARYEEFFNQIKNTIIKPEAGTAVIVNGLYMNPSENKTFNTIQFDLMPASSLMQKVNIDLVLKNTGNQWKIVLSVYDKDMKDIEALSAR